MTRPSFLQISLVLKIILSCVWFFIVLTIDRALLSSYHVTSEKQEKHSWFLIIPNKKSQFGLRIVIAFIMGIVVAHPLTLSFFGNTINSKIEEQRREEIKNVEENDQFKAEKERIEKNIKKAKSELEKISSEKEMSLNQFVKHQIDIAIQTISGKHQNLLNEYEKDIKALKAAKQEEQEKATKEEKGERGRKPGRGPIYKEIMKSIDRLDEQIKQITDEKIKLEKEHSIELKESIESTEKTAKENYHSIQKQKEQEIANKNEEIKKLEEELKNHLNRITIIKEEQRSDILNQTLILHNEIWKSEGGYVAITLFVVLSVLLMLVDIIPILIRHFAKASCYDKWVNEEEAKFDYSMKVMTKNLNTLLEIEKEFQQKISNYEIQNTEEVLQEKKSFHEILQILFYEKMKKISEDYSKK